MQQEQIISPEQEISWREKLPQIPTSTELKLASKKLFSILLPSMMMIIPMVTNAQPTMAQTLKKPTDKIETPQIQETLSDWVWASYRNGSLKYITGAGIATAIIGGSIMFEKSKFNYVCQKDEEGNILMGSDGLPLVDEERIRAVEDIEILALSGTNMYLIKLNTIRIAREEREERNIRLQNNQ
jgi:hypothetical protein